MTEPLTITVTVTLDPSGQVKLISRSPELEAPVAIGVRPGSEAERILRNAAASKSWVGPPVVRQAGLRWEDVTSKKNPHVLVFGGRDGVRDAVEVFEDHFELDFPDTDFVYVKDLPEIKALVEKLALRMREFGSRKKGDPIDPILAVIDLDAVLRSWSPKVVAPVLKDLLERAPSAHCRVVLSLPGSNPEALDLRGWALPLTRRVLSLGKGVPWAEVAPTLRLPDDVTAVPLTEDDRWIYRSDFDELVLTESRPAS